MRKVDLKMLVATIVPVKAPAMSKKRLSGVLSSQERADLAMFMLEDVLAAVELSEVGQIVVISSDFIVRRVTDKFGVSYLTETRAGLNRALEQATKWCIRKHAGSVLIIPSDIPLVAPEDINKIVDLGSDEKSVVLSSSQNGGTNVLFRRPPNLIPARFGPDSFKRHIEEAYTKSVNPKTYCSPRINKDIDSAEDLKEFFAFQSNTKSWRFLQRARPDGRVA